MPNATSPARQLLPLVVPALLIGVASSLVLLGVSLAAEKIEHALWHDLPPALGLSGTPGWYIIAILTLTGVLVGAIVWKVPGHAGPDPATEGLIGAPIPARVVPSLLLASVLTLAGGVSLGPENPITAANIALAFALGSRWMPRAPGEAWVGLAAAGTIGALFGTPVAAALILSEMPMSKPGVPLWDRLFAPLIAAGAGSLTTIWFAQPGLGLDVQPYRGFALSDLLSASVIAVAACLIGLAAVYAFPYVHGLFRRIGNPLLMVTAGGLVLGLLGALGGTITLFKGLDQMKELSEDAGSYTAAGLALIIVVKLAALLVGATSGFRGGRIFPAVFLGVAIGELAHHLVGAVPPALAITSAVLGILIAVTRQGWLSLFMAVLVVSDPGLLPVLCLAALPTWLLATGRPLMQLDPEAPPPAKAQDTHPV